MRGSPEGPQYFIFWDCWRPAGIQPCLDFPCTGDSGGLTELFRSLVVALGVELSVSTRKDGAHICSLLCWGPSADVGLVWREPAPLGYSSVSGVAEGLSTGALCDHTSGRGLPVLLAKSNSLLSCISKYVIRQKKKKTKHPALSLVSIAAMLI